MKVIKISQVPTEKQKGNMYIENYTHQTLLNPPASNIVLNQANLRKEDY